MWSVQDRNLVQLHNSPKAELRTLYGVKRRMNLRLGAGLRAFHVVGVKQNNDISAFHQYDVLVLWYFY